ncbi:MAG TPA: transporter [Candidatus Limnocylindrales bacterium]|nr:transporter [Candidatus Limnocylindrales bacterium]
MKTRFVRFVLAASVALLPGLLQAQPSAHYVPGVEGIKAASLPPPGFYFRDYNYFYTADQLNNAAGNKNGPADLDAFTYANLPRVLWITDTKFLGGFIGLDGFLPLVYQQASANTPGPFSGNRFGVGDLFAEGTLSWHLQQFDFAVGSGVDLPTGDSPARPGPSARPGLGYWTFMQTAGATWYIDQEKTWAVSALNRLEFNTEQRDTKITYGDAYTLEWGVSKTVAKVVDLGAVGYYQQQFTGNSNGQPLNRVAAVGPEVNVAFPNQMLFVSLRYDYEFMAESRAQGHTFTLTLTKRF